MLKLLYFPGQQDRTKRHTIASDTFNLADVPQRRTSALRAQHEQQIISNDNKHRKYPVG